MSEHEEVVETEANDGEGEYNEEDIDAIQSKFAEIDEESKKLEELSKQIEGQVTAVIDKEELDSRSVYIGNVDYAVTAAELEAHFRACGTILRVTILNDKWSGHPKGFAYLEFADKSSVANAAGLNESVLRGRPLKVAAKRTNLPTFPTGRGRRGRARGFRSPRRRGRRPYHSPY